MTNPCIAAVLGDPAGVGPELIAKLIAADHNRSRAAFLVVGDRAELKTGIEIAGVSFPFEVTDEKPSRAPADGVLVWNYRGRSVAPFARAEATKNGGVYSLDTLQRAIELTTAGVTDGMLFGPLNKSSLHQAGLAHEDESQWFAHLLGAANVPHGELNYLDDLWTSRVTSHVALKDVPALITRDRILDGIRLAHSTLTATGVARPRIAVCGLNPHNGDNGSFGREEIEIINPTVEEAQQMGFPVEGPFPADTIFLRAKNYDAIVTMYHDQGQIAMKLMGFSRGVTIHGGLPIPITTPAHGTAFDIHGQGKANPGAIQAAFDIGLRLAISNRNRAAA
ncbi:4-hydroxythreonine-4-phosphate dehydrogenase PdxA [Devosia nitrariae]|uniref:4-hydroxythreonine-4-phosphate dehydrogenase 2 n=1 Tax=Devosia nitrariae TaxID=2071872 RepID=A0ABQ5W8K0_9HYPH|nr:4-hydroxythreonine-4-phosphate dehydrogenase PdxA [Devosia nitrariae]GLQ56182.1 4-hydroxythreonine-4-phosphate dehydrogenase 2 [Devosia nitrariae]